MKEKRGLPTGEAAWERGLGILVSPLPPIHPGKGWLVPCLPVGRCLPVWRKRPGQREGGSPVPASAMEPPLTGPARSLGRLHRRSREQDLPVRGNCVGLYQPMQAFAQPKHNSAMPFPSSLQPPSSLLNSGKAGLMRLKKKRSPDGRPDCEV